MKKLISLSFIIICMHTTSCQEKNTTTMHTTFNVDDDNIFFHDQPKTGYFIQINNQNCHYKILVEDFLVYSYHDLYPAYSVRPMLNSRILKSGIQTLSIILTPLIGSTLSANADIEIKVLEYADMSNITDFGGATEIFEWQLPSIENLDSMPILRFDTTFTANVPYDIKTLDYAFNLAEIDRPKLEEEVVTRFQELHKYIKTDYSKFNRMDFLDNSDFLKKTRYYNDAKVREVYQSNLEDFQLEEYSSTLQPIENYKLILYGNGRVATLERLADGGRIIWCKDQETGEEILSLPLFIYKDTRDNQWHIW